MLYKLSCFLPNTATDQTKALRLVENVERLSWTLMSLRTLRVTGKRVLLFFLFISSSQLACPRKIDFTISGLREGSEIPKTMQRL